MSLNSMYGIPDGSRRVGNDNGLDIYYDPGTGEYWEVRNNAGGFKSRDQKKYRTKFPQSTSDGEITNFEKNKGRIKIQGPSVNSKTEDGNILKYPHSRQLDSNADYVVFEFFKYNPPFGKAKGGDGEIPQDAFTGNPSASYKKYNQSIVQKKASKLPKIILYMPEDVQSMYSQKWGGADFGSFAAGLLQAAGTEIDGGALIEAIPGTMTSATYKAITDLTNKITGSNISINQAMGGVSGTILNPNTEMMYDGPNLRTFDLTFKLVAYDSEESLRIKRICNTFKKAMLPSFGGASIFNSIDGAGNLITIPNVCQVSFMQGPNLHPFLSQYKTCAISDVSINYTADGAYATYTDGAPVATQLKISFKEMKNIFAEEIRMGGPSY